MTVKYGADPRHVYPTPADAIIVAEGGSDSTGDGTVARPYASITYAVTQAAAGGAVAVRGGTYHEGGNYPNHVSGAILVPVDKPGLTIQNYEGEEVWCDGSRVVTGWAGYDNGTWRAPFVSDRFRDATQVRGQDSSSYGTYLLAEFPIAHWPEQLFIDGVKQTQVQTLAEVGPGKFFVQGSYPNSSGESKNLFRSSHYVIGSNPAGREVRISAISRAFTNAANDTTLRGIGFRRYVASLADFGVVYANQRSGFTVENVTILDVPDCALDSNGANLVMRNCTFIGAGRQGVASGTHSDNGLIEWCYFERTNDHRFNYGPIGGAIKAGRCWNFTVRNNRFHDNRGHGIWFDECVYNARIYGNHITDNYGIGILYEISARAWIVNNIIVNNGIHSTDVARRPPQDCPAIDIKGSSNCEIWHNTIINPEVGVRFSEGYRKPLNDDGASWRTTHPMGSVFGQDKGRTDAFYQAAGYADVWDFYRTEMTWTDTGSVLANNVFAGTNGRSSVYSCFVTYYCEDGTKGAVDLTGQVRGPNAFFRADGMTPQRFANSIKATPPSKPSPTVVYFNMTGNGHDGSPSWNITMGDAGSTLASGRVTIGAEGVLDRNGVLASAALATVPEGVQDMRSSSAFRNAGVGAGDPGDPPPPAFPISMRLGGRAILVAR